MLGVFFSISKKWYFFDQFGEIPCVAPWYCQMKCFNISLESALVKLQNAHINQISSEHWKYVIT
jgi:hypothetical protein